MSRIGNARYKSPPNTIPSRITGRNTIVISNLEMLHAARMPKKNNFPKMPNRKIKIITLTSFATPLVHISLVVQIIILNITVIINRFLSEFMWETPEELDLKLAKRVRNIRKRRSFHSRNSLK